MDTQLIQNQQNYWHVAGNDSAHIAGTTGSSLACQQVALNNTVLTGGRKKKFKQSRKRRSKRKKNRRTRRYIE